MTEYWLGLRAPLFGFQSFWVMLGIGDVKIMIIAQIESFSEPKLHHVEPSNEIRYVVQNCDLFEESTA